MIDGSPQEHAFNHDLDPRAGVRPERASWTVRAELQDPESVEVHLHCAAGRDVLIELSRDGELVAWGYDGHEPVIEEVAVKDLTAFGQVFGRTGGALSRSRINDHER